MSEENVELARRFYPAPIDVASVLADPEALKDFSEQFEPLVEPGFETISDPGAIPLLGKSARGVDGFIDTFREWLGAFESWVVTATEFIDLGENRVLVMAEIVARSETDQAELSVEGGNILTFRHGKLRRLELFLDRRGALKAAGLSE